MKSYGVYFIGLLYVAQPLRVQHHNVHVHVVSVEPYLLYDYLQIFRRRAENLLASILELWYVKDLRTVLDLVAYVKLYSRDARAAYMKFFHTITFLF